MNEYQFTKACIKVFGLVVLLLGLLGLVANASVTGIYIVQYNRIMDTISSVEDKDVSSSKLYSTTLKRTIAAQASRMIGDVVKIAVGLYLCRRSGRLVNWLVKDDPSVQTP